MSTRRALAAFLAFAGTIGLTVLVYAATAPEPGEAMERGGHGHAHY